MEEDRRPSRRESGRLPRRESRASPQSERRKVAESRSSSVSGRRRYLRTQILTPIKSDGPRPVRRPSWAISRT